VGQNFYWGCPPPLNRPWRQHIDHHHHHQQRVVSTATAYVLQTMDVNVFCTEGGGVTTIKRAFSNLRIIEWAYIIARKRTLNIPCVKWTKTRRILLANGFQCVSTAFQNARVVITQVRMGRLREWFVYKLKRCGRNEWYLDCAAATAGGQHTAVTYASDATLQKSDKNRGLQVTVSPYRKLAVKYRLVKLRHFLVGHSTMLYLWNAGYRQRWIIINFETK